jgi:hypothetical protein
MNFSRHFYAVAGIVVILSALSLGAGGKGAARSQPMQVNVTNSTLNPVNTKAVGTTAVSGSVSINNSMPIEVHQGMSELTPVNEATSVSQEVGTVASGSTLYTVPEGKMLVMESESFTAELPVGEQLITAQLFIDGKLAVICLNAAVRGSSAFNTFYEGSTPSQYHFPSGTVLTLWCGRNDGTGSATYSAGFSGYLVPMPPTGS